MNVEVYIKGTQLDRFKDEDININLNVKNLSDISKIIADYTQGFSVPASAANNKVFSYWFNADLDGDFNANLRVEATIEVNSLSYRVGTIQMDDVKMKNGLPYSYDLTFYAKGVSLNDAFGDDTLRGLNLSAYNHSYNAATVLTAMNSPSIANGDIYYPMINAVQDMSIGNEVNSTNLISLTNNISYRDFKPALRLIRIIEAIETKYGVQFSRDFFGRAIFHNLFMWLHSESGAIKAFGEGVTVDVPTDEGNSGFVFSAANDTITFENSGQDKNFRRLNITVKPNAGFENVPYKIVIFNNGDVYSEVDLVGFGNAMVDVSGSNVVKFEIRASEDFSFFTDLFGHERVKTFLGVNNSYAYLTTPTQSISASVFVSEQIPDMKITDLFSSLISQFNLIIQDQDDTEVFLVDTLDNWYSRGKTYDITNIVDITETTIKKPEIKKEINFKYEKAENLLGVRYYDNFQIGYGDLKAKYDINGETLKIESMFENMIFERLQDETTGDLTDLQVGYAIDKELKPSKGAPIMFYRNGYVDVPTVTIQPTGSFTRLYHTATENNLERTQVNTSLNFGDDNSTFFLSPIDKSLYFNFWKSYIDDIYNSKTRVINVKAKLPPYILNKLQLNDKLIISQNKNKIVTGKINLVTGDADLELITDYSLQLDSVNDILSVTVDSTLITVDSTEYTVDSASIHVPTTSYILNEISLDEYLATASADSFEINLSANTNWFAQNVNTGYGDAWFSCNKTNGSRSEILTISIEENTGSYREGNIDFNIGGTILSLRIIQTP